MTNAEINTRVKEVKELQRFIEELTAEMESKKDELKAFMGDTEEVSTDEYKLTYKTITSSRLDTTALKKELPEIATRFTKTTASRRFCIA